MNIKELIKEHHHMMIDKGFHDIESRGISKRDHVIELIALIGGELLGEALEAHRCGRFADGIFEKGSRVEIYLEQVYKTKHSQEAKDSYFEGRIKDTFEDEIADCFLRLFDLSGYLGINSQDSFLAVIAQKSSSYTDGINNIAGWLFSITMQLGEISHMYHRDITPMGCICMMIRNLEKGCEKLNIPIEKHIRAKMAYNRTRPHKHGKEY